jgi:hypothetical protein
MGPIDLNEIRVLEERDGELTERGGIADLVADPPFRVTLSATIKYQTWEPVDYAPAALEPAHAAPAFETPGS